MNLLLRFARLAPLLILALLSTGEAAQTALRSEVVRLDSPEPVATGERIEVLEFFYYACPICYELQPHMSRWLIQAPEYVALRRIPELSSENWEPFAKLYFTLETLVQVTRLHWPVYDDFHFDGVKLNEEAVMLEWVSRNGVDRQQFAAVYASDEVKEKIIRAREMMKRYDVRGVPTIVVDGKYLSSARLAGGAKDADADRRRTGAPGAQRTALARGGLR
jgi:thiol:disulfide interchange protein DsbA